MRIVYVYYIELYLTRWKQMCVCMLLLLFGFFFSGENCLIVVSFSSSDAAAAVRFTPPRCPAFNDIDCSSSCPAKVVDP